MVQPSSIVPDFTCSLPFLDDVFMLVQAVPSQRSQHIRGRSVSRRHHMLVPGLCADRSHPWERRRPRNGASSVKLLFRENTTHESPGRFTARRFQESWKTVGEGLDTFEDLDDWSSNEDISVYGTTVP